MRLFGRVFVGGESEASRSLICAYRATMCGVLLKECIVYNGLG